MYDAAWKAHKRRSLHIVFYQQLEIGDPEEAAINIRQPILLILIDTESDI